MSPFRKPGLHPLLRNPLQGLLAFTIPLTPLVGHQHPLPTDFSQLANPANQGVIIDLEAPPPQLEPVPPPEITPQPLDH